MAEPITPSALAKARREVRAARAAYYAARKAWLAETATLRAAGRSADIARMISKGSAIEEREDYYCMLKRLGKAEARPVVKGSHVCPATRESLIRRGIWKADDEGTGGVS